MKAVPKEFCAQAYILDHNGDRIFVDGQFAKIGITIKTENKKQAMRIFDERESESHEFIEWW